MKKLSRRTFVKQTMVGSLGVLSLPLLKCQSVKYNSYGLPTRELGSTGVDITRIAFGCGSRFCNITDEDEALELLEYALNNGIYYWDTAPVYMNKDHNFTSEQRLGKILKDRRKEVFLSTKLSNRNPDKARKTLDKSLKDLQTDHLDMIMIHDIQSVEDATSLLNSNSLVNLALKLKEEGITRFIGFSGHRDAEALKMMANSGLFDNSLLALNQWAGKKFPREEAIPVAQNQKMGVMVMKAVRSVEKNNVIHPEDMIRYALSVDGVDGLVLGIDSKEILDKNIKLLREFTPMNPKEKELYAMKTNQLYFNSHHRMPWMEKGYTDGHMDYTA